MELYAAPMEGLTGFAWRKAHRKIFGGADRYYTPFVVANQTHRFKTKEIRDLTAEEDKLVPQVMTDKAEHLIWAARELESMGYEEINLNTGCPSATVVTRGKGSGLLREPDLIDRMLDSFFEALPKATLSVKTRIGFDDKEQWNAVLDVFDRYPLSELIVHPRLRSEFYEGRADRELFSETLTRTNHRLVFNGDVMYPEDAAFAYGCPVMAGRGLLRNPALFRQARGGAAAGQDELREFHDLILENYMQYMGPGPAIHHMKTMWVYFEDLFEYDEKTMKRLRKARSMSDYVLAAEKILQQMK